jgi:hypothetical protein
MVGTFVDQTAFSVLDGLWWLLLLLGPLLILQRSLHREIQAVFLLVTRRVEISLALFSIVFFPGVLLHEGSHYLMARVLGVRTGRFSLLPQTLADGRLQLGFVETSATDIFRDALIGIAPLLAGGAFVAYAGLSRLGLTSLWGNLVSGNTTALFDSLSGFYTRPDFWLWFYLAFAASSTMLPSRSDRRAWLPLALMFALLLGASLLAGAGQWLVVNLASPFNQLLRAVAIVFAISAAIHLVLLPPLWILRRLLSRMTGLYVAG